MMVRAHVNQGASLSKRAGALQFGRQLTHLHPASLASRRQATWAAAYKEHDGREPGEGQGKTFYELRDAPNSPSRQLLPPAETGRGSSIAMVLGGGPQDYTKLYPLTEKRALPAVPVGGSYRLVDIPISNLLNSGINKLYIITQFNSQSLNRHLTRTYSLPATAAGRGGFIEVLSISQYPDRQSWSEGTADSVRQFLWIIDDVRNRRDVSDIFILPADQLYRTDFSRADAMHRLNGADITILALPVTESQSEHMGVCKVEGVDSESPLGNGNDKVWWVTKFMEKPKGEAKRGMDMTQKELRQFKKTSVRAAAAVSGDSRIIEKTIEVENQKYLQPDVEERPYIGSTGIYIFRRSVLVEILEKRRNLNDFGSDVIPWAIETGLAVQALQIEGSWRDIGGSIMDFYQASMDIANSEVPDIMENCRTKGQLAISTNAPFFDPIAFQRAIYQAPHSLPPFRLLGKAHVSRSNISPGVSIGDGSRIVSSIVGLRSKIGNNVEITDSIIMGSDYYEKDKTSGPSPISSTFPRMGIGAGSVIKGAIVDKNARIGKDVQLVNSSKLYNSQDFAPTGVFIRDGIIVVTKSAVIPDGTII